jgi:predicted RNA-binding protein with PUA-like domain
VNHWLVKSEPSAYSWDDFTRDGATRWDGVRNPEARNNLARMAPGDRVLFYHSNEGKQVVGVARVTAGAYPDPTADGERWLVVDLEPVSPLAEPVALPAIKADPQLRDIPLVTRSRLSVMPLSREAYERILALGRTRPGRPGQVSARAGRSSRGRRRTRSSASRRGP